MLSYFESHQDYFWSWEDQKQVVAVRGGGTIAYQQTIIETLEAFKNQPIPSFGALLLMITATNESLSDDLSIIEDRLRTEISRHPFENPVSLTNILEDTMLFLRMVSKLPDHLKKGKNRSMLISALFEGGHNMVSNNRLSGIITVLKEKIHGIMVNRPFSMSVFLKDFRTIAMMVEKYKSPEGILKHLSGIPVIKEDLLLQESTMLESGSGNSFIDQLIENPSTFQIGTLIQRIWSGLNIPYHLSLPSGQPLGGFSDITNKGDYDKILVSEFANEDIIFMSRLANNEALFLRREEPPADEEFERIILVDVSIKNWGTPKILAYALLIAISNHPKTDITCKGFAVGKDFVPIDFKNVEEVINSLNHLDTSLHPAEGLSSFLSEYKNSKNTEVFYISSPDSIKYPEMQSVLNEYHSFFKYWVNVNSAGNILLYKNQFKTKRLIQEIKLPLNELWHRKQTNKVPDQSKISVAANLPLLIPAPSNLLRNIRMAENEGLIVTRHRDILRYSHALDKKGLLKVTSFNYLTKDTIFAAGVDENNASLLVFYVPNQKKVFLYNLSTQDLKSHSYQSFQSYNTPELIYFDRKFYFMGKRYCYQINYDQTFKVNYISDIPHDLMEFYNSNRSRFHNIFFSVLQNIKRISINSVENILINGKHELRLNDKNTLNITNSGFNQESLVAMFNQKENTFEFTDGSKIETNKLGYLKFMSSSDTVDTFYIPIAIEIDLAIATNKEFGGNQYFRNESINQETTSLELLNKVFLEAFIKIIKANETQG